MIHPVINHILLNNRGDVMVEQKQDYATLGLKALNRAVQNAIAEAKRKNLKIPIWKEGKIEYINPKIITEQREKQG